MHACALMVNLTCESSEMEVDAVAEVADEWLTVEALDTDVVAVYATHKHECALHISRLLP